MSNTEEVAQKIDEAIEKAKSANMHLGECNYIIKVLNEVRAHISGQSNGCKLEIVLLQINHLCNILDSLRNDNWSQSTQKIPDENLLSNVKEIMQLLMDSLRKIGIELTNKYSESISNSQQASSIETYSSSIENEHFDFSDIQMYQLQRSDYKADVSIESRVEKAPNIDQYLTYQSKMAFTEEDVTVTVFKEQFSDEKFRRLVNVLAEVKHPNLESFVGAVLEPPYTVVTRLNGEKLSTILKREKEDDDQEEDNDDQEEDDDQKNEDQIIIKPGYRTIIAYEIASAMAYLHSLNIIHRDLCTSNIMVDKKLNARITNFVNSRFIPKNTLMMSYKPKSKSEFRAPEITDMEGYDKEVDVFSFSGILYELLTNSTPFSNMKKPDVMSLVCSSERPELGNDISKDLRDLIESCWNQDPKKRPSFVNIMQKMLTNSITFPQDKGADNLTKFYAIKKIKDVNFQACIDLFTKIQEEINESFVYTEEATRIRTFLYRYQYQLQTSKYAGQDEIEEEDVRVQMSSLRSALEGLLSTLIQTEVEVWKTIALTTPVLDIPKDLHQFMEQIYISLSSIGLEDKPKKYNIIKSDLQWDLRFISSIIRDSKSGLTKKNERLSEIFEYMKSNNLHISVSRTEINSSVDDILSDWKDKEIKNRSDYYPLLTIGEGMSSKVFKAAVKSSPNTYVAIKEIKNEYLQDKDQFRLIRREIATLSQLKNDYLVDFIGYNNDPGKPFWIIYKFYDSGNLKKANKRLKPYQKTKISFEIAQGMEYLRSKRIIHRDLKPENILLEGSVKSNDIKPKISDFGLAREDSVLMKSITGSPNYMAPEVLDGGIYNFKADVFSFGMILWELYSEDTVFRHRSIKDFFNMKLENKNQKLNDLEKLIFDTTKDNPEERPSFEDILKQMCEKKIAFNRSNQKMVDSFYNQKDEVRNSRH